MIISKNAEIRVDNSKLKFYKKLGYKNIKQGDIIILSVEYLSPNSNSIVDIKCDYCETILKRKYSEYNRNISIGGKFCCKKCTTIEYKEKCLEKYGVDNTSKLSETHDKIKNTCLEKYGVENFRNSVKTQQTKLKKYKGDYSTITEKSKISCLMRYGVENASQNSDIFYKQQKARYEIKQFKNTNLFYQGTYELDFLNKYFNKIEITKPKEIDYIFNNKNKKYFPDYYLSEYNLIIEIKSIYTFEKYKEQNLAKQKRCIEIGYNYLFIINKDYTDFDKIINNL
jgi:hypothetical protein